MMNVVMQGMSQAFTVIPTPPQPSPPREELRPTTTTAPPPPTSLDTSETGETSVREEERETNTTIHFLEFPHKSYSYAVLEKKWSL